MVLAICLGVVTGSSCAAHLLVFAGLQTTSVVGSSQSVLWGVSCLLDVTSHLAPWIFWVLDYISRVSATLVRLWLSSTKNQEEFPGLTVLGFHDHLQCLDLWRTWWLCVSVLSLIRACCGLLAGLFHCLGGSLAVPGLECVMQQVSAWRLGSTVAFWWVSRVGLLWLLASWIAGHSFGVVCLWVGLISFQVLGSGVLQMEARVWSWFGCNFRTLTGFAARPSDPRLVQAGISGGVLIFACGGGSSGLRDDRDGVVGALAAMTMGFLPCLFEFCSGHSQRAQMPPNGSISPFSCTANRQRIGSSSSRSWCTVWRWFFTVLILSLVRVGEASHPGPQSPSSFTLGIANPSGLNGKLDQINHLEGDAWILSETHLSQQGISTFVKGLKMLRSPWKFVVPGAPSPARQRTDTGTHTGVMFLSKYPARALPHTFDVSAYASARLQVAGMAVADTWVTVGLLYGLPENAHHKQARYQTDAFLAELVDRVGCQTTGPRVIGGDFNFGPTELQQLERLQALGFREVQDLAAWRFGISAKATGRGSRRIDQMWISPELQSAFLGVQVSFDHWADHAAVSASFSVPDLRMVVTSWPVPRPFPWPASWSCHVAFDSSGNLTEEYAKFWCQVETQAKCWNQHHGVFVTKKQCGRAAVLETTTTREPCCPVKKARKGDVQPTYMGTSLEHARYFRQLRRLQSLCRALQGGPTTLAGRCNRDETWRAIRRAVGFPGGFGLWWNAQGLTPVLAASLPLVCPPLEFIQGLFQGFQSFVQVYEKELARQRYQHAKHRRASNLAFVFQDCKDDPLPKADTLIDRVEMQVEEVREDDSSVVLTQPVALLDSLPLVSEGQVVQVVAHHADQVWLDSTEGLSVGSVLSQERPVTSDTAILQRFADAWGPRWVKQSHVQPGQWTQICGFLDRVIRPIQWEHKPWTLDRLTQAFRQKKPRAAKGPDGVSQPDLVGLPPSAVGVLVQLLEQVEAGRDWPSQLANGFVSSLAKKADAQQVDQFRPVVVYSLLYRVWSTERAREALRSIAAILPASVQGGVPARQAKTIWYELASALELAYMQGTELHGVLMDIQKAFNNIPRHPLWHALNGLCFPEPTLRAWVNFVTHQTRRFRVRRSVGEPLWSTCGLPEGCALSVFGMVVVDWVLDLWISALEVRVSLRTFVDDWGLLFQDAGVFDRVWASVEEFTGHMDLAIDLTKTRIWSNQPDARKQFRDGPLAVALSQRNLGAHQNFSRHSHNAEVQKRLAGMPPIWIRLRASQGPYHHKISAIHMMAGPRALHGISVVHLGDGHFCSLRSGAMRALKSDRKGANPALHLVTSSLLTDPEAWAVVQTVRDARDLGDYSRLESLLGLYAQPDHGLPSNGPTAVLFSRLSRLGWGVGGHGLVQDRFGCFSLVSVGWDELRLRIKLSWGHVLSQAVMHRSTFAGIENADLTELHQALKGFGPVDQVYLRCHLDGTLFTQNGRAKFTPGVTSKCPWCPLKDGFHHRAWICPHFASCRAHLTADQLAVVSTLPSCLQNHGCPVILPEWDVFARFLLLDDGFCRMSPVIPPTLVTPEPVTLFLDGTSAHPKEPKLRYAAWAVTVVPGGPGTLDNRLLMGGHVVGLVQSPFRAELTAMVCAVRWAVQRGQLVHLWSDCQGVVRGLQRLLQQRPLKRNRPHSDLWMCLQELLVGEGRSLVKVFKVVSHGQTAQATGPLEEWAYWHNNLTDRAADAINQRRSPEFWEAWTGLVKAVHFHRRLHVAILQVLLQTSRVAAAEQTPAPKPVLTSEVGVPQQVVPATWVIPDKAIRRYGRDILEHMHAWWTAQGPMMLQGSNPLVYISGIQLFMAFNVFTGYDGPWCHKKRWYSVAEEAPAAAHLPWGARVKWFLLLWKSYLKGNKVIIPQKVARPCSASVAKWLVCYRLRWTKEQVDEIDSIVFAQMRRQVVTANDVALLNAAKTV